ncbi:MAG: phosphatidate cytidylyltransferase [Alphaproteobacteria bacterium]|nr:phosphatidate cytidylyltransferase [Alphaproteobacteria bacterium]
MSNNTKKRILVAGVMVMVAGIAVLLEYLNIPAVRWLAVAVACGMVAEFALCVRKGTKNKDKSIKKFASRTIWFLVPYSILLVMAAYFVGTRPWIILLMLLVISAADIGAWFFGRLIGGDKMWPELSPGKTWSGQIAGILCGTMAAVLYGLLGTDRFMPQLMWIGMSVALMSQYGDLTASWLKRRFGVKDFSNILPGHGGIVDRFDGWIYALPIVWLVLL